MRRFILCFLIFPFLSACAMTRWKGTDTGNPGGVANPTGGSNSTVENPSDAGSLVASKICSKIRTCFPGTDQSGCTQAVLLVPGLASSLGYFNHSTLNEVLNDVSKNVNSANLELCSSEIVAISCGSAAVNTSYSSASSGDYSNVGHLLSATTSCSSVGF
jgi:hypothetical protein